MTIETSANARSACSRRGFLCAGSAVVVGATAATTALTAENKIAETTNLSDHSANPLEIVIFESRNKKPRSQGITMMIDWGLPPAHQKDLLRTIGSHVDLAKIAVGTAALYPPGVIQEKLDSYRSHGITPFTGGMFIEHAMLHNKTSEFLKAVVDLGFDCIEVSDNLLDMTLDEKCELIRMAHTDYKLRVLGEVGKKEGLAATADFAEDTARCLEAGAERVFLEAADFFARKVNDVALNSVIARCGVEPLMFELPGPWIKGITLSDVQQMTNGLIERFGPNVNIGNVMPEQVLSVEAQRVRLGLNAGAKSKQK
jgi:phosphosulfolactate synthase